MRKTTSGAILAAVAISACRGEGGAVPPPQAPHPPPMPALIDLQRRAVVATRAAMNAHDARRYAEFFAPDAMVHEYGLGEAKGREAIAGGMQGAFDGFPDYKIGVSRIFVKNDVLAQEWVITGTNKGEFNGAKPTNKTIGIRGASVLTFSPEGLIKIERRYFDTSTVLSQLGLMKGLARPVAALPSGEPEWHIAQGTPEEDKLVEIAKAITGALEKRSEADFLDALSENVSWSIMDQLKDMSGKASAKQFFGTVTKAFADATFSSSALFGVDGVVVSESSLTATHAGSLGPLTPTKKRVTLHGLDIMVVKDGKMASRSSYSYSFELLGQEGLLPKPSSGQKYGLNSSDHKTKVKEPPMEPVTFPLAADERDREKALRARFGQFWSTAAGDPRTVYDTFISAAAPIAAGVTSERIETPSVKGWWVRPPAAEHDGVIVYLHGGSYVAGSAKAYRGLASQLASRTRRSVLVLDYPLAPEATVPAAPDTVMEAYEWLKANGSDRIAFVGDSAGGGLSLVTVARLAHGARTSAAIAGVVFSPWVDLAFTGASMKDQRIEDPLLSYKALQNAARMYLGKVDSRDPLASPLFGDLSGLPPLLIQVGTDERLVDDARQFADRAALAGTKVRIEVWEGMHHVFQINVADLRTSGVALDRAAAFLLEAFAKR